MSDMRCLSYEEIQAFTQTGLMNQWDEGVQILEEEGEAPVDCRL